MQHQNSIPGSFSQQEKNNISFRKFAFEPNSISIPISLLRDAELSFGALGLLLYLLQLPEFVRNKETGEMSPWVIYLGYIRKERNIGEIALNTLINELVQAGYMMKERSRGKQGRFAAYEYVFAPFKIKVPNGVFQPGSSSLDNQGLNNSKKETSLRKTTTASEPSRPKVPIPKPPDPVAVSLDEKDIYSCLQDLDIPIYDKKWLTKTYSRPLVELSVTWSYHPTTKITKSLQQALKWFCKNSDLHSFSPPPTPEENKAFAEKVQKEAEHPDYQIVILNKNVEISPKNGGGSGCINLKYDQIGFQKNLINVIRQKRFKEKIKP